MNEAKKCLIEKNGTDKKNVQKLAGKKTLHTWNMEQLLLLFMRVLGFMITLYSCLESVTHCVSRSQSSY